MGRRNGRSSSVVAVLLTRMGERVAVPSLCGRAFRTMSRYEPFEGDEGDDEVESRPGAAPDRTRYGNVRVLSPTPQHPAWSSHGDTSKPPMDRCHPHAA